MQTSEVTNAQSADLIIYMEVEQVNHRVNGILRYINVIKLSFNYINKFYIYLYIFLPQFLPNSGHKIIQNLSLIHVFHKISRKSTKLFIT